MKKIRYMLLLAAIALALGSCRKKMELDIEVSFASLEYAVDASQQKLEIKVDGNTPYTIFPVECSWLTVQNSDPKLRTITLLVEKNTKYDSRSEVIKVLDKTTMKTFELTITQAAKDAIVVAKKEYNVASCSFELSLLVAATVEFEAQANCNWISVPSSRALEEKELRILIKENDSKEPRTGTVTLRHESVQQTITITQSGSGDHARMQITHSSQQWTPPSIANAGAYATIDWGDGQQGPLNGDAHSYSKGGQHTATIDAWSPKAISIDTLGTITEITIFTP